MPAGHADRLGLVPGQVVAQARGPGVHARAAQLLLVGVLPDGHLDQRRPAEEDAGPVLDHDGVVAHAREVGAAGGRRAEDDADGRDALRRELGQAAELLAAGHEDVGLAGQVGPSGLDQDQQREAVLLGHVHGAQELADRRRARRPAAHGRVVGDDQALGVGHLGQRHDDAAADRVAGVQAGQRAQLEHGRAGVDQRLEALAHHHLAAGPVALDVLRAAAGEDLVVQRRAPRRPARRMASALSRELVARRWRGATGWACSRRRCPRRGGASPGTPPSPRPPRRRRRARPTCAPPAASPSAHACAGQRPQQVPWWPAPRRARPAGWRVVWAATQASSAALVVDDGGEQPRRGRLRRAEALAGERQRGRGSGDRPRAAPAPGSWPAPRRPGPR